QRQMCIRDSINVTNKTYSLYYEICEGDEIYYNFTLVPEKDTVTAKFLLDDPWGGKKDNPLKEGVF
ncbi:hypothetical protein ACNQ0Y_23175, partial [Enterobacter cloacae complex sp.6730552]